MPYKFRLEGNELMMSSLRASQILSVFLCFAMMLLGVTISPRTANADVLTILPNSGFEQVTAGKPALWSVINGDVTSSTYIVHSGAYSVKLADPSDTNSVTLRSQKIPVTVGWEYEASAYSYNTEGSSVLYLEFWDSSNNLILFPTSSNNT